jgi:hypothetical protein
MTVISPSWNSNCAIDFWLIMKMTLAPVFLILMPSPSLFGRCHPNFSVSPHAMFLCSYWTSRLSPHDKAFNSSRLLSMTPWSHLRLNFRSPNYRCLSRATSAPSVPSPISSCGILHEVVYHCRNMGVVAPMILWSWLRTCLRTAPEACVLRPGWWHQGFGTCRPTS